MNITVYVGTGGKITIHYPEWMTEEEALAQVYSSLGEKSGKYAL